MQHIKVNGTSWCNYTGESAGTMFDVLNEARRQKVYPVCQHNKPGEAERFAAILAAKGIPAQVVDGPCDQRSDPYEEN